MPMRLAFLALWLGIVLIIASNHIMWRDEVRALSFALEGGGLAEMLAGLRGDGHPALWYLLLRIAHDVMPVPQVLPVMAMLIGAGAMAVLALRAPFRPVVIVLVMVSSFGLYEFVVMARNYGLSMLFLFLFAALYRRARDGSVVIPLLLFLLCNSNVHSVLLAGAMWLVWYADTAATRGWVGAARKRRLIVGAAAILLGAILCYWEVGYPLQDAVHNLPLPTAGERTQLLMRSLAMPGFAFDKLDPRLPVDMLSLLLWLALVGLAPRPGLLVAGLAVQVGMTVLFVLVYPGGYRHAALYVVLLLTLYWLAAEGFGGRWPARLDRLAPVFAGLRQVGCAAMLILLLLQERIEMLPFLHGADAPPESSSAAVGRLLARPGLRDAIVMGDPDFHLEALPYYADNPTYLVRESRYGRVVRFTSKARLAISLEDILDAARQQGGAKGKPVVILLHDPIEQVVKPTIWHKGYVWTLSATPEQVRAFRAATRRLQTFGAATSDENYTAYLLPRPRRSSIAAALFPASS